MATSIGVFDFPFTAGGDLSSTGSDTQYRFVRIGSLAPEVLRATGASNPFAIGILQSNPNASGLEAPVRLLGTSQVYADATCPIGYGSFLKSGSDGQAVLQGGTSSSDAAQAIALEALSSGCGVLIECLLIPGGIKLAAS